MINAKRNQSKNITLLWLSVVLLFSIISLIGCDQQPKSMFEQQADTKAADEIVVASDDQRVLIKPDLSKDHISGETNKTVAIQVNKQQAIAHQRNCDPNKKPCQYFELNVLDFVPEQPWLSSIMWKTIAQILAPNTPLASQDQAAKNTILMLLKQIEYSEQAVNTSSLYQRIDTELVLNPVGTSNADAAIEASSKSEPMATGYLLVRSTVKRGSSPHHLDYVMLDIQKKLQLTIEDILLPTVSTDSLLLAFQGAKEDWLISQGVAKDSVDDWSLPLSPQWYLDEQGLHLVYQSTELLEVDTEAADLLVPYSQLTALIKPAYIVQKHS
ncbi:hypothetical protein KPY62_13235 [Psychrobacter sp. TAE2020]|uniref:hypothetical protein n=1 Tax=Psychrobacter sp. TAE2020 TaxID=2846762 RepID=UPI001C0F8E5A|nr:hypothetical protein [Psychrobacter sp. TAE2020]MBU5618035.1 hypothetical protein [Psychrobacter sp. TAE2020]